MADYEGRGISNNASLIGKWNQVHTRISVFDSKYTIHNYNTQK